jgi:cyclase
MARIRVIPVLLLKKGGLYKSIKFRDHKYVGDPINAVKIFNEKEVDELVILDTDAAIEGRPPDIKQISEIAGEAFMPVAYGGGITSIEQAKRILYAGIEKVVFNTSAIEIPGLIEDAARQFGSSSVMVSIDVKKDWLGRYKAFTKGGSVNTGIDPVQLATRMEKSGAGEIFLNSIDRDGTYMGYDLTLIKNISEKLSIPVVVCGGASSVDDFKPAIDCGASAVAAGSMFVFQKPHNAVLINYPSQKELNGKLYSLIP